MIYIFLHISIIILHYIISSIIIQKKQTES